MLLSNFIGLLEKQFIGLLEMAFEVLSEALSNFILATTGRKGIIMPH